MKSLSFRNAYEIAALEIHFTSLDESTGGCVIDVYIHVISSLVITVFLLIRVPSLIVAPPPEKKLKS